ncbi:SRPBCC domain-containing protein [Microbacterium tumbae]
MTTILPPLHREVIVNADPGTAFAVFTDRIDRWWPVSELSVFGAEATVAFVDGTIVETSATGETSPWGRVTRWDPPHRLDFSWHPGRDESLATAVTVQFLALDEDRTLVTLEHAGWERLAAPAAAREEYGHGWPKVLERYAGHLHGEPADEGGETWVALLHRSAIGRGVFDDPRFAGHIAFLRRRAEAGELIAAGSFGDGDGEGMTILRLAGPDRIGDAERLANEDDRSVAEGLFGVRVRPWRVVMHA